MDKNPYRHDRRADKNPYRHDRRADKNSYRHDHRADSQCQIILPVSKKMVDAQQWYCVNTQSRKTNWSILIYRFLMGRSTCSF